jgi:hypothetical protein
MNIFAHGLWGVAISSKKQTNRKKLLQSVFFSVAPDIWLVILVPYLVITGNKIPTDWTNAPEWFFPIYALTHSLVLWLIAFIGTSLVVKRPYWPQLYWLLHILIDIPGHTKFSTPFLYPVSSYKYHASFSWESPFYILASISIPIIIILVKSRRARN